jgi:hypothetical protein
LELEMEEISKKLKELKGLEFNVEMDGKEKKIKESQNIIQSKKKNKSH